MLVRVTLILLTGKSVVSYLLSTAGSIRLKTDFYLSCNRIETGFAEGRKAVTQA